MQADQFQITIVLKNESRTLNVSVDPSSDGADTYICRWGDNEITHVRKDTGEWKQLWGDLDDETINQIGKAIEETWTK